MAPNHKRTSANGMCNDTKLGNFHCVVLLDDISSKIDSNTIRLCVGCGRSFKGEKGLKIHLSKSSCGTKQGQSKDSTLKSPTKLAKSDTHGETHPGCMTCPKLIKSTSFYSSVTGRHHNSQTITQNNVNCKLQNCIYLITCDGCKMQYVGESIIPLHQRINIHRTAKTGCKVMIDHFENVCKNSSFSIQIIEKLDGNGYKNGSRDKEMYKLRLEREDHWMKTLRTVYPYGLNDKTKEMSSELPVGKLFKMIPRYGIRNKLEVRTRSGGNPYDGIDSFLEDIFSKPVDDRANFCRKRIESFNLKTLKKLAVEADKREKENCEYNLTRWYAMIKDYFFTKKFKSQKEKKPKKKMKVRIPVMFHNKGLDMIKLSSIINHPDVLSSYPHAGEEDKIPAVIYRLYPSIRSKIFNYKETVASINTTDNETFGTGIQQCHCANSIHCDQNHGHIITGNLQIIKNAKLRKLFTKGPNFREPRTINWRKCRESIVDGLNECIASISTRINDNALGDWKATVLRKVDEKIEQLKSRIPNRQRKQILKDQTVLGYLEELQKHFVLVPIDKASNNIAVICKKYYVEVILKEVGVLGQASVTYTRSNKTMVEIIHDDLLVTDRLKLKAEEKNEILPSMYWMPKMHKNPTGQRFIIASKFCSTKPLSKTISSVFNLIFNQIENFRLKAKFFVKL